MDKGHFKAKKFFDLSEFSFASIFSGVEFVWEVLPKIENFVAEYVGNKRVVIGEGTIIEEGAFIKGPAIIGENCTIAHGAYIRENVILDDNIHVGHGVELKNSIVLSNTAIAHLNYVGDSIVGSDVNIGGGAKTANFRLDGKTIKVKVDNEVIDTGLTKFGAIIADGSKIGVNAVLNPGTILGKNCLVYPLTSAVGVHEGGEVIK